MSVAAISASSVFDLSNQNVVSKRDSIQKEFQQLGQDLQSGDLTAAQSDFTTLQQLVPKLASISTAPATTTTSAASTTATSTAPATQSTDPRVQAFQQLEQDIQAGNTSASQQDYSNIQQIFQDRSGAHNNHRLHEGGINGAPGGVQQLFQQLGTELQSGSLSQAQQTFATLQQDFVAANESAGGTQPQSTAPTVSLTA